MAFSHRYLTELGENIADPEKFHVYSGFLGLLPLGFPSRRVSVPVVLFFTDLGPSTFDKISCATRSYCIPELLSHRTKL